MGEDNVIPEESFKYQAQHLRKKRCFQHDMLEGR
jgi:hypothetical protein